MYADKDVLTLCTNEREARRELGEEGVRRLKRRIKELESATTYRDLFEGPGRWHPLHGDRAGTVAAEVTGALRLVVSFLEEALALVISIEDYH